MTPTRSVDQWRRDVLEHLHGGARFGGVYGRARGAGCLVIALLVTDTDVLAPAALVAPDAAGRLVYPSLTPDAPPAFWWERALRDLSGVTPEGHPRLDPLLLPPAAAGPPRPGSPDRLGTLEGPMEARGPTDVTGRGLFVLPIGPVRSGVAESIEFLLETPGEDIPHLNIRPHFKHRGVAKRFEGLTPDDGVLVAERVEGIAAVAHALAFCHAAERLAHATPPPRAELIRVVHAELERIANHLDVAGRLAEAAGLAVAVSRFAWHKESVLRLRSALCGSRFGRGVIVPGGVAGDLRMPTADAVRALEVLHHRIRDDARHAMRTASFLDRLRGTGRISLEYARTWALVGPVARGSGIAEDSRWTRPTDAYAGLKRHAEPAVETTGDVQARLNVRFREIDGSVALVAAALRRLDSTGPGLRSAMEYPDQELTAVGWSEAPHGEVLNALTLAEGRIVRCFARSPSLQNLVAFHDAFGADVFTDFAFVEASFGVSYAGVAM